MVVDDILPLFVIQKALWRHYQSRKPTSQKIMERESLHSFILPFVYFHTSVFVWRWMFDAGSGFILGELDGSSGAVGCMMEIHGDGGSWGIGWHCWVWRCRTANSIWPGNLFDLVKAKGWRITMDVLFDVTFLLLRECPFFMSEVFFMEIIKIKTVCLSLTWSNDIKTQFQT